MTRRIATGRQPGALVIGKVHNNVVCPTTPAMWLVVVPHHRWVLPALAGYRVGVNRRSRRLLLTTNTELKAMAAPAISGLSRPSAASGRAATL